MREVESILQSDNQIYMHRFEIRGGEKSNLAIPSPYSIYERGGKSNLVIKQLAILR